MDLHALLAHVIEVGGSDLHLKVGNVPLIRVDGDLLPVSGVPRLTEDDSIAVLDVVAARTPLKREAFMQTGDLDTAYAAEGIGRFRVNGFRQRGAISFAFRFVPKEVPSFGALGLPPGVERLAEEHRGLIVVTGATGSGKTTTLAAMIDHVNRTRRQHIVTLEDPIEIVHDDRSCLVSQREIGLDTESFQEALRRVLRQDPDVILIGELRDEESARAALQAGESGHLVLSTMHTIDAAETVGRLIELFPSTKQQLVRQILAGTLRGVVSQRLLPRIGGGRVAAVEVMVNTARIAELILDPAKTEEITRALEQGQYHQMQNFQQHLVQLVLDGLVDAEVAAAAASNRHDFELALAHAVRRRQAEEAGFLVPEDDAAALARRFPETANAPGLRLAGG
ncbi:MAG: PilT/PilU family type 4a pilus ATPase [Thermoleophilia bacterium]